MAGLGLSGGFAAGGGADALEQLLQRAFVEQQAKVRNQQEQQRIDLEAKRTAMMDADRKAAAEDVSKSRAIQGAGRIAGQLRIGQNITQPTIEALKAGEMGDLVQHEAADLPSRAISGVATTGATAPLVGRLRMTQAGRPERDTFTGTAEQLAGEQARTDALAARAAAQQERTTAREEAQKNAAEMQRQRAEDQANIVRLTASLRPPAQTPLVMVDTVDEQGNPVRRVVKKEEGASFTKPANATTATRTASAETVNAVGNDIITKLSDPKFKAAVGPLMGRAGTLRDFIGNPPPEFSELAGQIESYALANMGVHGMRSAQGAEAIKKLLDQRHTPESLAATIRGLNDFSTRFVAGNKPKSGGAEPAAGGGGSKRTRYDMNGNVIKD